VGEGLPFTSTIGPLRLLHTDLVRAAMDAILLIFSL
jgi:hypothetical protein